MAARWASGLLGRGSFILRRKTSSYGTQIKRQLGSARLCTESYHLQGAGPAFELLPRLDSIVKVRGYLASAYDVPAPIVATQDAHCPSTYVPALSKQELGSGPAPDIKATGAGKSVHQYTSKLRTGPLSGLAFLLIPVGLASHSQVRGLAFCTGLSLLQ